MAIKVNGATVITNSRRGVFRTVNPGSYTTAERPPGANEGDVIYDSDEKTILVWNGTEWVASGGGDPTPGTMTLLDIMDRGNRIFKGDSGTVPDPGPDYDSWLRSQSFFNGGTNSERGIGVGAGNNDGDYYDFDILDNAQFLVEVYMRYYFTSGSNGAGWLLNLTCDHPEVFGIVDSRRGNISGSSSQGQQTFSYLCNSDEIQNARFTMYRQVESYAGSGSIFLQGFKVYNQRESFSNFNMENYRAAIEAQNLANTFDS